MLGSTLVRSVLCENVASHLYVHRQRSTATLSFLRVRNDAIFHHNKLCHSKGYSSGHAGDPRSRICVQPGRKLGANRTFSALPHPCELLLTFFKLPVVIAEPLCRVRRAHTHTHTLIFLPGTSLRVWNIASVDGEHSSNCCGTATSV